MRVLYILFTTAGAGMIAYSIGRFYKSVLALAMQAVDLKSKVHRMYKAIIALMTIFLSAFLIFEMIYVDYGALKPRDVLAGCLFFISALTSCATVGLADHMCKTVSARTGEVIQTLVNAVDAKDNYTKGHSVQVLHLSGLLYRHLPQHLKRDIVFPQLRAAAIMHDIGKIGIADRVLDKPGRLTPDEMEAMKLHPLLGKQILEYTSYGKVGDIIYCHHERMDGTGYYGLPSWEIPLESRIIAIADTFSALYTDRVYRAKRSYESTIAILKATAGGQLDQEMVQVFCDIPMEEVKKVSAKALEPRVMAQ